MYRKSKFVCVGVAAALAILPVAAQESAKAELDRCIQETMIARTVGGAVVGAFLGALLGDKDRGKAALQGAIAGGAAGYASAYFNSVGSCYKSHPDWIPESKLVRTRSFDQAAKEMRYKPSQGAVVSIRKLDMNSTVKAGEELVIRADFIVLTPDKAETPVQITRKLSVIENDAETAIEEFPGRGLEEKILEPGKQIDEFKIPISQKISKGSIIKIEYAIAIDGKEPDRKTAMTRVQ